MRSTNGVERPHREVRRRVRVVSIFPNKVSWLRLVSAVLSEINEEWLTGRVYITFQNTTQSIAKPKDDFDQFTENTLR